MKLTDFLADLGSSKGAPGGGAAAALTGAAAAALVEMTARLNDARLKKTSGNAKKAASLRMRLHSLIAEDAKAFETIQAVFKIRKTKPAAWQAALKKGAKPPLAICECAAATAVLARAEKDRTGPWLESDRLEALILAKAAFDAAVLNVEVNLKSVEDEKHAKSLRAKIADWARHVR